MEACREVTRPTSQADRGLSGLDTGLVLAWPAWGNCVATYSDDSFLVKRTLWKAERLLLGLSCRDSGCRTKCSSCGWRLGSQANLD